MSNYNTEFQLNLEELETIEHSMLYRLKRLTTRRLTAKKDSSKEKIDVGLEHDQQNSSAKFKTKIFKLFLIA